MAPPVKQTLQRKPRASSHEEPSGGIIIPVSSLIPPPPSLSQRRSSRMPPRRDVSNYDGLHSATPSSRSSLQPSSQPFSQQLGKRKRPTASQSQCSFPSASTFESTKFSESVKAQIRRMSSGQKCWHCGADGIDVAHIIPGRAARQLFPDLTASGLVNLEDLKQKENGLPLCKACHHHFDESPLPSWTFYPEDLQYFIKEERKDIKRRQRAWRANQPLPRRSPPTAAAYFDHQRRTGGLLPEAFWGTYCCYIIHAFGPQDREFVRGPSGLKTFHGDPMVALYHAFPALPYSFVDLPKDLRTLNTMYCENDQMINHMKAPLPNISDDEEDSDSTSDGTDKKSWIDNSPDPTKDRSRPRHSKRLEKKEYAAGRSNQKPDYSREDILVMLAPSRKPKAMMQEELFARSMPCKRAKTDDDADWEFGPGGTAQDAIEFFSFFNGGGYEDKGPWAQPVDRTKPSGTAKLKQGLLSPKVSGESIS